MYLLQNKMVIMTISHQVTVKTKVTRTDQIITVSLQNMGKIHNKILTVNILLSINYLTIPNRYNCISVQMLFMF